MEIVTWVLQGSLVHQDSTGHNGVIYPGLAQRMSAGTRHPALGEERLLAPAASDAEHQDPVHFVQMWVVPDEGGITPGYEQLEIDDELLSGGLVPVASGMDKHDGDAAIRIQNRYAALHAARLQPGQSVELPEAPYLHLFVPRGAVTLEGAGPLGDRRRRAVHRDRRPAVTATEPAEILVWEMHARHRRLTRATRTRRRHERRHPDDLTAIEADAPADPRPQHLRPTRRAAGVAPPAACTTPR